MFSLPRAMTLSLALLLGCAGAPIADGGARGTPCEGEHDCRSGLACKAAKCQDPRSPPGGVCVTEAGCEAGLLCVQGLCSTGRAGAADCRKACAHLRQLMGAESDRQRDVPAHAGEGRDPLDELVRADFERQCYLACTQRASRERAQCLLDVQHVDEIKGCP